MFTVSGQRERVEVRHLRSAVRAEKRRDRNSAGRFSALRVRPAPLLFHPQGSGHLESRVEGAVRRASLVGAPERQRHFQVGGRAQRLPGRSETQDGRL
jgi:hypothetical protein